MRRDGVGLLRRQSGGGAVLLYAGVLCWEAWAGTAAVAAARGGQGGIRQSYAFLAAPVIAGLRSLGVEVFSAGVSDLSLRRENPDEARKLAGTAQLRRRDAVLVHGSLLVTADLDRLGEYLRFPSEQPDYRRDRRHRDFCLSVREALGAPGGGEDETLIGRTAAAVAAAAAGMGWDVERPPDEASPDMMSLIQGKYGSADWNWRGTRNTEIRP